MANSSPSPKARNTTIIFVTVVTLLLMLSYYIFVYVPAHEDKMHEQHTRVLNKIAQNIKTKLGSTINNAKNIARTIKPEEGLKELKDRASFYNNNITYEDLYPAADTFAFEIYLDEKKYNQPGIYIRDSVHVKRDTSEMLSTWAYDLSIPAEKLVSNLLRFDHFEKFALFSDDRALYETHPTGSRVTLDSLFNKKKLINTSHFREVTYGGLPYVAYFRPLRFGEGKNWVLTGFISSQEIAKQKFSLSPLFSIILLLFIILTFLSIPFIKIKIMHVREHLTLKEVALSFLSVTFIVSILILLVLLGYSYWGIDKPNIERELQNVSEEIRDSLVTEVETVLQLLNNPDPVRRMNSSDLTEKFDQEKLASVENIFFVKGNGDQDSDKKSITGQPTPVINIKSRRYFSKAKDPNILCSEGFVASDTTCFYLESIISYNTGKQLAAMSVSSQLTNHKELDSSRLPVVAATGRFHSIIKTVLPFGYGFAVLDKQGDVLFHSDSNLNLQENFFEELEVPEQLEAHVFGRSSGFVKTDYHDQSTLLHITPVENWPISLVTYYDTSLLSLKYLEIFTLYATVYSIIGLGLLVVFFIGFLIEKSGTAIWGKENQELIPSLNNLPPQKGKKECYTMIVASYLVLLPVFILWAWWEQPAMSVFLSAYLVCLMYWILRYFFSNHSHHVFWFARMTEFAIFSVTASFFLIYEIGLSWQYPFWPLILGGLPILYGWLYHCSSLFSNFREVGSTVHDWLKFSFLERENYMQNYCRVIFLGSLSFSLLLTCFIYKASYLQETEAIQKYGLVQFSRAVANHETGEHIYFNSLKRDSTDISKMDELAELRIDNNYGIYFGATGTFDYASEEGLKTVDSDTVSSSGNESPLSYLFYPHPYQLNTKSKISNAHVFNDTSQVENLKWEYSDDWLFSTITYKQGDLAESKEHRLAMRRASLSSNSVGEPLFVFLLLAGFLLMGYSFVKQIVGELFILRKPENYQFKSKTFKENLESLISLLEQQKHLYLVTIPVQFREILKKFDRDRYELVSWTELCNGSAQVNPNRSPDNKKPLVVTGFNHGEEGDKVVAMRSLKKVMECNKVILVSNYDPLDLLQRTKQQGNQEAQKEHDALADLLAEFETYYFPLTGDTIKQYQAEKQNEDLLVKELNIYYELWNSLTPDEQYVLYDLTNDGLVNTRNLPIIHRLYKKGLITEEENNFDAGGQTYISSLKIFNGRFQQFVDNLAETENLKELEEEINATGTWKKYRTPLLITLTGILLFVFITQQETYGEVVSVLGSIAASLPLLLRLMNSFFAGRNTAKSA